MTVFHISCTIAEYFTGISTKQKKSRLQNYNKKIVLFCFAWGPVEAQIHTTMGAYFHFLLRKLSNGYAP